VVYTPYPLIRLILGVVAVKHCYFMLRPFTNRWAVLALIFLIGIAVPMQFQAVLALVPFLVRETALTYSEIGVPGSLPPSSPLPSQQWRWY
jgi:hypothetical protein